MTHLIDDDQEEQLDMESEHMAGTSQQVCDGEEQVDVSRVNAKYDSIVRDNDGENDDKDDGTQNNQDQVVEEDVDQTWQASSLLLVCNFYSYLIHFHQSDRYLFRVWKFHRCSLHCHLDTSFSIVLDPS